MCLCVSVVDSVRFLIVYLYTSISYYVTTFYAKDIVDGLEESRTVIFIYHCLTRNHDFSICSIF